MRWRAFRQWLHECVHGDPTSAPLGCGCTSRVQYFCIYCFRSACERHQNDIHDCGIARSVPFVDSNHPTDCAADCCFEIRLTEKTQAFPWDTYEQEMAS